MFLWSVAIALAAPVDLPEGAAEADWAEVCALVGLEIAPTGSDGVQLVREGSAILVTVWTPRGRRSTTLPFPVSRSDREAVVQAASSLLRDIERPALPPLPAVRPKAPSDPVPFKASPLVPPPLPAFEAPTPELAPPQEPQVSSPPAPQPVTVPAMAPANAPEPIGAPSVDTLGVVEEVPIPSIAPSVWGSVGLELRTTVRPAARVSLWGGVTSDRLRLGGGVEGVAPAGLVGFSQGDQVRRVGGLLGAWGRWRFLELGPVTGVWGHGYRAANTSIQWVTVPTAGASLGVMPIPAVRAELRAMNDLRQVQLFVGDSQVELARPWSVQLGVGWVPLRGADGPKRR